MTCIIGTPRFLCADRKITADGEKCHPEVKLWSNPALVAAAAGETAKCHRVRDLIRSGCTDPVRLIDAVGETAHALVLVEGELWEVVSGSMWHYKTLRCIGSGCDLARGYLEGKALNEKTARAAQKFVASLREDCGAGCDFLKR